MSNGVFTRDVSEKVASGLQYFIQNPGDKRYFNLPLVRFRRRSGSELPTSEEFVVAIRLIDESPNLIARAGGGEIARCITNEGKRIDIMFGKPDKRHIEPATIDIEE